MVSLNDSATTAPLVKEAPKIRITEHPALVDPYDMLENNDIDFAIHFVDNFDTNFTATPCGRFSLAIFAGKHHPLLTQSNDKAKKNIRYEDCLQYNFIAMNHGENTQTKITSTIHAILADPKYTEKLVFKSNQLLLITELLATTDSLYIGPEHLLKVSNLSNTIVPVFTFDLAEDNKVPSYLIEHKRVTNSSAHQWLKQIILQQFNSGYTV